MGSLKDIPKIDRLARKFGNPLQDVTFIGEGVRFTYKVGNSTLEKNYGSVEKGIQEEIKRLEGLLAIE